MRALMRALCVLLCLSGAASADDDDGGDSDTSQTVTEGGPEPDQPCEAGEPCKRKMPRVDFEAWDRSRKALDEAGKERPGNSNVRP